MSHGVCPHWVGYFLVSPLRRLFHNPEKILQPFVNPGMTVLDVGCAMGWFTIPLARMVGHQGKVVAVDVQEKMLRSLAKRARKAEVGERIVPRACTATSLEVPEFEGIVDFAVAFAVVHEVSDAGLLFQNIARALKPGGRCLVAEPKGHVRIEEFQRSLSMAEKAGLYVLDTPKVAGSHAALLRKG
ncbi:class I SAM-dependent methyltransferase [Geotalea toluenoxydans]|uniref:class I SAM-dependent methyltransferase n=1 Tax=Geotalea toluenoxydans TaxID=421624 RepID=UPI0006D020E5|nr:class I SAM-dependent methyltransferase [Geotalea toluenoxydans]